LVSVASVSRCYGGVVISVVNGDFCARLNTLGTNTKALLCEANLEIGFRLRRLSGCLGQLCYKAIHALQLGFDGLLNLKGC
jgi:hypothetical protein